MEHHLQKEMTIDKFKELRLHEKQDRIEKLGRVFIAEFYQYTRDNGWMQEALGNDFNWIHMEGMSEWHIKAALHSLKGAHDLKSVPPVYKNQHTDTPGV